MCCSCIFGVYVVVWESCTNLWTLAIFLTVPPNKIQPSCTNLCTLAIFLTAHPNKNRPWWANSTWCAFFQNDLRWLNSTCYFWSTKRVEQAQLDSQSFLYAISGEGWLTSKLFSKIELCKSISLFYTSKSSRLNLVVYFQVFEKWSWRLDSI